MSASFICVWWTSSDSKIHPSCELKEGAAPDRGEKEVNVLFSLRCSGFSDVRNAV